jgi:hypothetical protein
LEQVGQFRYGFRDLGEFSIPFSDLRAHIRPMDLTLCLGELRVGLKSK